MVRVLTGSSPSMQLSVSITEDLIFEPTEHFNLSISTTSDGCTIPDPIVDVYIMDDGERKHALVLEIELDTYNRLRIPNTS